MFRISLLFTTILFLFTSCQDKKPDSPYLYNNGEIFGTFYNIKYQSETDLKSEIQSTLNSVDYSLSTYKKTSTLSKINNNQEVELDSHFTKCFERAYQISDETHGAFDMTVANLVNIWGFGFKKMEFPTQSDIDSLMQYVGYKNVTLNRGKINKTNPNFMIDASAIAKGYGVDAVADLLELKGVGNYLVEIGGEIRLKGHNDKNKKWSIGIDKPEEGSVSSDGKFQLILAADSGAIATSGNYRQFYYKDGQKYSHTIDPKTGFPVNHRMLSTTVYSQNCISSDAYATAFMVMGPEKVIEFSKLHPELGVYIIFSNDSSENKTWMNSSFEKIIRP